MTTGSYWPRSGLHGSRRKPTLANSAIVSKVCFPSLSRTHAVGQELPLASGYFQVGWCALKASFNFSIFAPPTESFGMALGEHQFVMLPRIGEIISFSQARHSLIRECSSLGQLLLGDKNSSRVRVSSNLTNLL